MMGKSNKPVVHTCIFCENENGELLHFELTTPNEKEPEIYWVHRQCFNRLRDESVEADDLRDHGSIPKNARCVFCGQKLPIFGKHPFCFDLGDKQPPDRYWTHADCLKKLLKPGIKEKY